MSTVYIYIYICVCVRMMIVRVLRQGCQVQRNQSATDAGDGYEKKFI